MLVSITFSSTKRRQDLTNARNLRVFSSDGVFGSHRLGRRLLRLSLPIPSVEDQRYTSVMRKRQMTPIPLDVPSRDEGRLDLDRLAVVEFTSEDKDYPVESALGAEEMRGWRAAASGPQTIRLIFDKPQKAYTHRARLRRNRDRAHPRVRLAMVWGWRTLVSRNCAPALEDYRVELSNVTVLELTIVPDISRGSARASPKSLRLS